VEQAATVCQGKLAERACCAKDLACCLCIVTPQRHNRNTTFHDFAVGIAVKLSSSFDAGLCVVE
jgi:hypothetical protein